MDVSGFVEEIFAFLVEFFLLFFGCEEILNYVLVFFLVFFSLLGAWQFFDEKNVDDLDEFVLDQFVVDKVENLVRKSRIGPIIAFRL